MKELDADPRDPVTCGSTEVSEIIQVNEHPDSYGNGQTADERDDEKHFRIGALHFAVLNAAISAHRRGSRGGRS